MLRLTRRAFPPIVALLCVGAAMLWWRSYGDVDLLFAVGPTAKLNAAASYRGRFVFLGSNVSFDPSRQWSLQPVRAPTEEIQPLFDALFDQGTTLRASLGGFQLGHGRRDAFEISPTFTAFTVPHWFVVIFTGVPTLLWLRRSVRSWGWARQGRCRACGYDLRSSPDRCPECGETAPRRRRGAPTVAAAAAIMLAIFVPAFSLAEGDPTLKSIAELDLKDSPLQRSFEVLRDLTHANIVVRWPALEAAGIARTTTVSLRLWNVRLGTALDILLDATESGVPLAWSEKDGIITVSTQDDLARYYEPKVYDVRDLVAAMLVPPIPNLPEDERRTWQEMIDELTRLVTETIEADSWRDAGGSVGSIREIGGRLIVTQTPENQKKLKTLLALLREEFAKPTPTTRPATQSMGITAAPAH